MTHVRAPTASGSSERLVFAMRQAALLGVALLVAGFVTERLRPDEAIDRGFVSTQFLWAIVLWAVVLMANAVAFEDSQMQTLERTPLVLAAGIGLVVLVVGLVNFDPGPFGRRLVYLAANSLGVLMFWWAVLNLGWLLIRRVAD